jgi:hypothetical protein
MMGGARGGVMPPLLRMINEELQDLYPHENYATLRGKEYRMRWCNAAFLHAIDYYRKTHGEEITYDGLINAVRESKMSGVVALIYGAVRAANPSVDYIRFCSIYDNDHLTDNISAVLEGVSAYLPEPEGVVDDGKNLDESYPDTQGELKKKVSSTEQTGAFGFGSLARLWGCQAQSSDKPRSGP